MENNCEFWPSATPKSIDGYAFISVCYHRRAGTENVKSTCPLELKSDAIKDLSPYNLLRRE